MKAGGIVLGVISNLMGLLGLIMFNAAHTTQKTVTAGEKVGVGLGKGFMGFFAFVFSLGTIVMALAAIGFSIKLLSSPKKGAGAFALLLGLTAGYLGLKVFLDIIS